MTEAEPLGLLINYFWCTSCHTCETACQMEHGMRIGEYGIKLQQIGPWEIGEDGSENWQLDTVPVPSKQCDLCAQRRKDGKLPTCVKHCQAKCMQFGTIKELAEKLAESPTQVLFHIDPDRLNKKDSDMLPEPRKLPPREKQGQQQEQEQQQDQAQEQEQAQAQDQEQQQDQDQDQDQDQ